MSETNQELTQHYHTRTQAAISELASQLESMKNHSPSAEATEKAAVEIARLRKDFIDAISFLPSFDQRQFDQQLKSVESMLESLRASGAPKSKFAFKRKAAKPAPSSANVSTQAPTAAPTTPRQDGPTSGLSISGHDHSYLTQSSLSAPWSSASDLTISDLDHCIVNLIPSEANKDIPAGLPFTALHVRNLSNTVLMLPIITGSALLHDLKNCIIALGSRQFRMHTSSQVDVYISISSNPIIEHCSGVHFADYPIALRHLLPDNTTASDQSNFTAVQDFSHIRATASPNWSVLPETNRDWPVVSSGDAMDVLVRLLPSS